MRNNKVFGWTMLVLGGAILINWFIAGTPFAKSAEHMVIVVWGAIMLLIGLYQLLRAQAKA